MTTTYETSELISAHHAEVERLCSELLELGSRTAADDPEATVLRERARALCWRLRDHLSTEGAALMNDASGDRARIAELMNLCHEEGERIDRALSDVEHDTRAPLEIVRGVCEIARDARAHLDRAARA